MKTNKTVVILVSGKAGSGKSTIAGLLATKLRDFPSITVMEYGFADPIKYIAKAYFGWDGEKDAKGRRLLQHIGAVGREYNQDIWVKHFINQLDKRAGMFPFNFAIVSDWRFPNEFAYLAINPIIDVATIRVFGRGGLNGDVSLDVSENSLPEADKEYLQKETENPYYDFTIDNNVDLEILKAKLDLILGQLQKQYIVE